MWKSSKGFTLIEAILSLMLFCFAAASLPLIYSSAGQIIQTSKAGKNMEWELFAVQVRNELHAAHSWHVYGNQLQYQTASTANSIVSLSQYQDKIRRQINGQGHEIMLQSVKTADFAMEGGKVYIHVVFTNGEKESAVIAFF